MATNLAQLLTHGTEYTATLHDGSEYDLCYDLLHVTGPGVDAWFSVWGFQVSKIPTDVALEQMRGQ